MTVSAPVRAPLTIRCLRLDVAILTPTGKQVLATMATFANADGGSCFPSTAQVAQETGLGQRTVIRAIAHLRRIGALVAITSVQDAYRKRQAREYRIAIDHLPATPRKRGVACARVAQGLTPQTAAGLRQDGVPPSQVSLSSRERDRATAPDSPLRGGDPIAAQGGGEGKSTTPWDRLLGLLAEVDLSPSDASPRSREVWLGMLRGRKIRDLRAAIGAARSRMPVSMGTCSPAALEAELAEAVS